MASGHRVERVLLIKYWFALLVQDAQDGSKEDCFLLLAYGFIVGICLLGSYGSRFRLSSRALLPSNIA
jgi:hypothetical protein